MNLFEVSYQVFAEQWSAIVPTLIFGGIVAFWSLLILWIGFRLGWKRGVNDSPAAASKELRQMRFNCAVAEERLTTEKKVSKRFENVIRDMVEAKSMKEIEVKERIAKLRMVSK